MMIDDECSASDGGRFTTTGDAPVPRTRSTVLTSARIDEITADNVHADMVRAGLELIPHQVLMHDGAVLLICQVPGARAADTEAILSGYAAWLRVNGDRVTGPASSRRNPYYLTVTGRAAGIRVEVRGPLPAPGMARPAQITSERQGGAA